MRVRVEQVTRRVKVAGETIVPVWDVLAVPVDATVDTSFPRVSRVSGGQLQLEYDQPPSVEPGQVVELSELG